MFWNSKERKAKKAKEFWIGMAHMRGNIASSNGNENGGKLREHVAEQMTPSQLDKAQRLARECVAKNYKGC